MTSFLPADHSATGGTAARAAAEAPEPMVRLRSVRLSLGHGAARVEALRGVSLDVAHGEAVGLVGPSGSGKSSLLMTLAGLERPDSGKVFVNGVDITGFDEDRLARFRGRHIGIVFQSFHLVPTMTALENVALPLELAGADDAFPQAAQALERVGLRDRTGHYPAQLSGGEQQRVAIARAVVGRPPLVVADEPTGNLDEDTGRSIVDLLFALKNDEGATLVLVTHDPALAARCDRTVRLRSGLIETALAPEARTA